MVSEPTTKDQGMYSAPDSDDIDIITRNNHSELGNRHGYTIFMLHVNWFFYYCSLVVTSENPDDFWSVHV